MQSQSYNMIPRSEITRSNWTATSFSAWSEQYEASNAIDGTVGNPWDVYSSQLGNYEWFQIIFGTTIHDIAGVKLLKRSGHNGLGNARFHDIQARIGQAEWLVTKGRVPITENHMCDSFGPADVEELTVWFRCRMLLSGRYLTLQRVTEGYLEADEINVYTKINKLITEWVEFLE